MNKIIETTKRGTCTCCGAKNVALGYCWHYDYSESPVCDGCAEAAILEAEYRQGED